MQELSNNTTITNKKKYHNGTKKPQKQQTKLSSIATKTLQKSQKTSQKHHIASQSRKTPAATASNIKRITSETFNEVNKWNGIFPSFKSTNKIFAFILNSLAIGLATAAGLVVHDYIDTKNLEANDKNSWFKYFLSGLSSFFAAFFVYLLLLFLFGFGGGMLVNNS